jgi:chaperonin GroEL (HSP60 family)
MLWLLKKEFPVNKKTKFSLVFEKCFSLVDVAAHYLAAAGISAVRRTKKSDNNRISRATGASIVNDTADLKEEDVGTGCGLFEIRKIGDEYDQIKCHLRRFYIVFL